MISVLRSSFRTKDKLFLSLHACHSCGKVSCKHVQTAQTHNPQTKPPVAGTPGKTGNTTSSQGAHTAQRGWLWANQAIEFHSAMSHCTPPWTRSNNLCLWQPYRQHVGPHTRTKTSWHNTNRNCRRAWLLEMSGDVSTLITNSKSRIKNWEQNQNSRETITTSCTLPHCNSSQRGWEMLSDWGGAAPFKASVEGLVNEIFMCHMCCRITHIFTLSTTPFCSLVSLYFLSFPLASSSSSTVFSHITIVSSRQLFPPVCCCSCFSLFPCQMDGAEGQGERESGWQTAERPVLAGWPASKLFANGESQQQLTMQTLN